MEERLIGGATADDLAIPTLLAPAPVAPVAPPHDRELRVAVTPVEGQVQVDFGRAVWWVRLTPAMALALADDLRCAAERARAIVLVSR